MRSNVILFTVVGLMSGAVYGQSDTLDRRSAELAEQRDMALSIAAPMVVEAVDNQSGRVRLDGEWYRLLAAPDDTTRELTMNDLRPGMEVFVQTDGSEPSSGNEPLILAIWSQ